MTKIVIEPEHELKTDEVELYSLSAIYYQGSDCCKQEDSGNELKVFTEDGGVGNI